MIPTKEEKQRRKVFNELVNAGFYYMRHHNHPDIPTTPFKQSHSKKKFLAAIQAMREFLGENKVVKMKQGTSTYTVTSRKEHKLVHIIPVKD